MKKSSHVSKFSSVPAMSPRLFLLLLAFVLVPEDVLAQGGYDSSLYQVACDRLLMLIEGPFGALLTTAAGIGAIVSSAMGNFRAAWTLLVVSIGAFILRSYITLFFASCSQGF